MELTLTGYVAPTMIGTTYSDTYGYDFGGYFGPAGTSLGGDPFTVTWIGTGPGNPILDGTLTINGYTYDFGSGNMNSEWINLPGDPLGLQQVNNGLPVTFNGGLSYSLSEDSYLGTHGSIGGFAIGVGTNYLTQADLIIVPSPILGTGPLALAIFLSFLLKRSRKCVS